MSKRKRHPETYLQERRWRESNPELTMLYAARYRAKKQGVPCTITKDDIVIPEMCPVLGIKLERSFGPGRKAQDNSPSLDKIVPELGYVPGNVIVVSYRANRLKCDATPDELQMVVDFYRGQICQK